MDTYTERATALMDGPPPRTPQRVTERSTLSGQRVVLSTETGWMRDLRAVDDPYMLDPTSHTRWAADATAPAGADLTEARLTVSVVTEHAWYEWARTKRRPEVQEYPAYLVWAE